MKFIPVHKGLLLLLFFAIGYFKADATHLFGGEIFYTNVSGNTYKVTVVLYGDCSSTSQAFPILGSATPKVEVYNGSSLITTLTLTAQPGSGINVSPVCPDEVNNTTCTPNGTLPGIKKFIYAANVTLSGPSANWKFRTNGDLGNSQAGRTGAITNAVIPTAPGTGSLISLEATLNNLTAVNSSPTYTTIPTPFFCINKPQEYNQGAVDVNNDSLSFALVPALDASFNPSANVTYIFPYSATAPLGCAPGTFLFNSSTGQLSFTPNILQDALVVGKVSEYRNGVLIGTSMREMTFLVLNNCNNNPPDGPVTNPTNGVLENSTTIRVCAEGGTVGFQIHPTDVDGDNINITSVGIPAGAVSSVTSNNTTAPVFNFSWNINGVAPGTYVFYLTFTDDGCPLVSKQSVAYTVKIVPKPGMNYNLISNATCVKKGVFSVTPTGITAPFSLNVTQGATTILTRTNITGQINDSLNGGTYNFRIANAEGCYYDTSITLILVNQIFPQVAWTAPFCPGGNTGTATLTATGVNPPFTYAIGAQPFSTNNVFTGLSAGTYNLHIKDVLGCLKDTTVTIANPPAMLLSLSVRKPVCNPVSNGQVIINVTNGTAPYQYAINAGAFGTSNVIGSLPVGTHVVHVKDVNGCLKDTTITLVDSLHMALNPVITPIQCFGNTNGVIAMNASGTTAPYNYALGSGTFGTGNVFNNLGQGTYVLHATDANGCLKDTTLSLVQPALLTFTLNATNVSCRGGNNGTVTVNPTGGTPAYQYAFDGNAFQAANVLTGLNAGTHVIHLKDANNCVKDSTITITEPATAISFGTFNLIQPTCESFTDGSVTMAANGGTPPYQFSFNNGIFGTNSNFASIAEGTYVFKARDNNGCEIDTNITLTGFPHIILDGASFVLPTCNGASDGQITLNASGGRPPFMYNIDNGNTWNASPVFSNKASGNYDLSVRDENGCIKDTTVFLSQPDKIGIDTSHIGNDCNGVDNGGVIEIKVNGGTAPFRYVWSHNADLNTPKVTGLVNGNYSVEVIDANGCTGEASVEILYNNCCTPFIPNAFSPNGDDHNDYYKVEYKGDMELKEMYVYNRYGQRVFSSSNVNKTWDGTFNGVKVDGGTYFYYIRILCGNVLKKELIFKGDVTVVR